MYENARTEIYRIKKNGKVIALESSWQYWIDGDILYAISSDGLRYSIWCSFDRLNRHLHRLYQITGKKFFTEDTDMVIINKEFLSQFAYA